jgi:hypothetical protein
MVRQIHRYQQCETVSNRDQWAYWSVTLVIIGCNKTVFKQIQKWTFLFKATTTILPGHVKKHHSHTHIHTHTYTKALMKLQWNVLYIPKPFYTTVVQLSHSEQYFCCQTHPVFKSLWPLYKKELYSHDKRILHDWPMWQFKGHN